MISPRNHESYHNCYRLKKYKNWNYVIYIFYNMKFVFFAGTSWSLILSRPSHLRVCTERWGTCAPWTTTSSSPWSGSMRKVCLLFHLLLFFHLYFKTTSQNCRIFLSVCLQNKNKSRLYATSSSRLKHLEATGWFCQHLAVPCVKMSTCSKDHTQSCHLTVKTQFFLVSQERVHPPTQFLVVIYQLLRQQ